MLLCACSSGTVGSECLAQDCCEKPDGISYSLRASQWERMETVKRREKQRETLKGQTRPRSGRCEKMGWRDGEGEMKRGWKSSCVKWDFGQRREEGKIGKRRGSKTEKEKRVAKEGGSWRQRTNHRPRDWKDWTENKDEQILKTKEWEGRVFGEGWEAGERGLGTTRGLTFLSVLLLACRLALQWRLPLFTKLPVPSGLHLHNV